LINLSQIGQTVPNVLAEIDVWLTANGAMQFVEVLLILGMSFAAERCGSDDITPRDSQTLPKERQAALSGQVLQSVDTDDRSEGIVNQGQGTATAQKISRSIHIDRDYWICGELFQQLCSTAHVEHTDVFLAVGHRLKQQVADDRMSFVCIVGYEQCRKAPRLNRPLHQEFTLRDFPGVF
jgi:hypothetical protein